MKKIEGLNYREWQKRNGQKFNSLSKTQQQELRNQGYHNISWEKVQNSWVLLCKSSQNIVSLFEHKINKGDILGAIDLSILESDQAKEVAQKAMKELTNIKEYLDKAADETLTKYPLL